VFPCFMREELKSHEPFGNFCLVGLQSWDGSNPVHGKKNVTVVGPNFPEKWAFASLACTKFIFLPIRCYIVCSQCSTVFPVCESCLQRRVVCRACLMPVTLSCFGYTLKQMPRYGNDDDNINDESAIAAAAAADVVMMVVVVELETQKAYGEVMLVVVVK
jgi:hypothetical protein